MAKKYLYTLSLLFCVMLSAFAQTSNQSTAQDKNLIEGLQIYPNPTTNNRIYIITESQNPKEIEIYDLLGKKVFAATTTSNNKELNLSQLKAGVYLIQIRDKEKEVTVTRKLVLK